MTVPPDFDAIYRRSEDPWEVGSSWYERRKQAVLLASLSRERYDVAVDPACGSGHAAAALANRCGQVLALDGSASAVEQARRRFADVPNLSFSCATLPGWDGVDVPRWDLLVLGEFLYYLPSTQLVSAVERMMMAAADVCEVAAVHWAQRPHDGYRSGRTAHRRLAELLMDHGLVRGVRHDDGEFVLDTFTRHGG